MTASVPKDRGNDERREPSPKGGPRLNAEQRRILITALARYDDLATVREVCLEEDPDFPSISDRSLRAYRMKRDRRTLELMDQALDETLTDGLADKRRRIAELQRTYRKCKRRAREISRLINIEERTNGYDPYLTPLLRELRETEALANSTLKQLQGEVAIPVKTPGARAGEDDDLPSMPEDVDEFRDDVTELMLQIGIARMDEVDADSFADKMDRLVDAVQIE